MKLNIKKYMLALGIAVTLLPGCNDDFMERYPLDEITDESFWKSETDLKMMLNSLYLPGVDSLKKCNNVSWQNLHR